MKTRNILVLTLALMAGILAANFIVGCSEEQSSNPIESVAPAIDNTATPADSVEGRKDAQPAAAAMSSGDINFRIWSSALYYIGKNLGIQCKQFASDRVRAVTGYSLPTTQSNWIYYNAGHVVKVKDGASAGSSGVQSGLSAGLIIQMHIYYRNPITQKVTDLPHTAIFSEYAPGGMYWIDCNFVATNTVGRHFVTWDWFNSRVGTKYCVNQATQ